MRFEITTLDNRGFSRALLFCLVAALPSGALASETSVAPERLSSELGSRLERVPEFVYIEKEAAKLGVRAWLFGGTAAGFGHYVKWDLLREGGDRRFQPDRFDYDYSNIYRSNQDLDIVIDGTPAQGEALQKALQENFPHLQGSKTQWEVRLLSQNMGDKQALLNNPDFLNQHTDSNSTGMIEITRPDSPAHRVRDLRDWSSGEPFFLRDVSSGTLHYYYSPLHDTTSFAKEGRNPPVLSVIRYLTKAFQYELALKPEDLARIKSVIDHFDSKRDLENPYVAKWVEKNGKKLIQNAVNIEYAVNKLDELGLRSALRSIGDPKEVDSLAWWMNKEPLRSKSLGEGSGQTAEAVFLKNGWAKPGEPLVVAHETNNFLAYESITRAHTGDPNVLISRAGNSGEMAVHGDGFYTRVGREGARGTGLTIRFTVDPNAREGSDFELHGHDDIPFLLFKNRRAIRVIPESLALGPVDYFRFLANDQTISSSDLGVLEKLKRRISQRIKLLTPAEKQQIAEIVGENLASANPSSAVFDEWHRLGLNREFPDVCKYRVFLMHLIEKPEEWERFKTHFDPRIVRVVDELQRSRNSRTNLFISEHDLNEFREAFAKISPEEVRDIAKIVHAYPASGGSASALPLVWWYSGLGDHNPQVFGAKEFYEMLANRGPWAKVDDEGILKKLIAEKAGSEGFSDLSILERELRTPAPNKSLVSAWITYADPAVAKSLAERYLREGLSEPNSLFYTALWSYGRGTGDWGEQRKAANTPLGFFEAARLPNDVKLLVHPDKDGVRDIVSDIGQGLASGRIQFPAERVLAMVEAEISRSEKLGVGTTPSLFHYWFRMPESRTRPDLLLRILKHRNWYQSAEEIVKNPVWRPYAQEAVELTILANKPTMGSSGYLDDEFVANFEKVVEAPPGVHGKNRVPLTDEELRKITDMLVNLKGLTGSGVDLILAKDNVNALALSKRVIEALPTPREVSYGVLAPAMRCLNSADPFPERLELIRKVLLLPKAHAYDLVKKDVVPMLAHRPEPWVRELLTELSRDRYPEYVKAARDTLATLPHSACEAAFAPLAPKP